MIEQDVLYVDDEHHLRQAANQTFELAGIRCDVLDNAEAALKQIRNGFSGVLVTDIRMPDLDGVSLMRQALEVNPDLAIILVTGYGDVSLAVECIKNGAYDFLEKPCDPAQLVACVKRALERRQLIIENTALRAQVRPSELVKTHLSGRSEVMKNVRLALTAVAETDADILITGATGTGKERAARALHSTSSRALKPFVHINCAALPETLIESELFGHEAGAFPGATRARFGKLEHARGGILCLDEIDSLPLKLQAKLLDVLHNRVITRLGSNDPIPLDIRVVALSKTDLVAAAAEGRFRSDLLYRLNMVSIELPRIQDRREDIPLLFAILTKEAEERVGRTAPEATLSLLRQLSAQDWPGNIRELRNFAERRVLGLSFATGVSQTEMSLSEQMKAHEKSLISAAVVASGGRLKEAYVALGLSRKTLYDKMQKHGLSRDDFTDGD